MSQRNNMTPRADFWRDQKVRKASKVWTTRALEQDTPRQKAVAAQPVKRRADAQAFWTRTPLQSVDPVKTDL